ncbi:lipoprotein, NlpB [Litchfieldella rifensis]|uniref:Lipoprotein, NlpB n=1 Tax=Litchfieldella rifensis TaxID=762643 RepID=A0ABV7LQB4_9GAMM
MNPALKWMPLVVSIALVATGCARDGYYHDRNIDYTEAHNAAPLQLPRSSDAIRSHSLMPVPEASREFRTPDDGFVPPRPQDAGVAMQAYVERREIGAQRWLVVDAAPGEVWPRLEDFASSRGLTVTASDASRGVLTTDSGTLSVRTGLKASVSEVRCEQGGRTDDACLAALERYLSARGQSATASSLASRQATASTNPVHLERRNDDWLLLVEADAERTWAELSDRLEASFDQQGLEMLQQQDPATLAFVVDYLPRARRAGGILSTLLSPVTDQSPARLRLTLEPASGQTLVRVSNESERAFTADDSREFLERVAALLR